MRGVKIAVKADDSKEHSKVVPRSPLISSLPRLVPPRVLQVMFACENGGSPPYV